MIARFLMAAAIAAAVAGPAALTVYETLTITAERIASVQLGDR